MAIPKTYTMESLITKDNSIKLLIIFFFLIFSTGMNAQVLNVDRENGQDSTKRRFLASFTCSFSSDINVSFRLQNDKDLALVYLNSNIDQSKSIEHLSYNLRNDPELVDIAIKKSAFNIQFTGIDSYNCKSNIELVLKNSPGTVNYCGHSAVDYLDSIDLKYLQISPSEY